MAKKTEGAEGDSVGVVLSCILSGLEQTYGPGDTVMVDAEEAARLVAIGAGRLAEAGGGEQAEA